MDPTILASASMPSIASYTSLGRSALPSNSSGNLLAYLRQDSMQSISSHMADEERGTREGWRGSPLKAAKRASGDSMWRSTPDKSGHIPLRPLRNAELPTKAGPAPTVSAFSSAPNKRRPPPLQLRSFRPTFGSVFELADDDKTPMTPLIRRDSPLDLPSPWALLDDFPLPPLSIPRSGTSINASKVLRRGGNIAEMTTSSMPRNYSQERGEQDENVPLMSRPARKRKHTKSFGSLSKGFRPVGLVSVPNTPALLPLPERRSRSNSASDNGPIGSRGLTYSHRRDTFASRLFALASPKPDLDVTPLTHAAARYTPHETRITSCPTGSLEKLYASPLPARSVGRLEYYKAQERKTQETGGGISPLATPIDLGKPLVIPPRRTRSPSYIDLRVPPWRQTSTSPTQTSFVALGALISAPNTPTSIAFDVPNEMMHLPSSESMDSLRLEVDPFGAGEPVSFFRFEFGRDEGEDTDVSRSATGFYEGVEFATQGGISRRRTGKSLVRRNVTPGIVPEIVVVSSSAALLVKRD